MTFRQNSISFYVELTSYCIMALLMIALTPIDQIGVFPYFSLLFLFLAVLEFKIQSEFVTINEDGIICRRNGKPVWKYHWDEIVKLKRSARNRVPSMEIVIDDHANEVVPYDYSLHYFELGRKAREAVEQYYKMLRRDVS